MTLPSHLFISDSDGNLYDTRVPGWNKLAPLRVCYHRSKRTIRTVANLKAALRAGASTDLGGYPLYFITSDGEALSFASVRENLRNVMQSIQDRQNDGWRVVACDVNYEDDDMTCAHSGESIPSAYV